MRISDWSSDVCSSDLRVVSILFVSDNGIPFTEGESHETRFVNLGLFYVSANVIWECLDHARPYSPRCSCTNRTTRSRTSGENLLFLLMASFSQELKPPQNPVRSKDGRCERLAQLDSGNLVRL